MIYLLENLYYQFYRLVKFLGEDDMPRYNAVLLLSICTILNFISGVALAMIATRKIILVGGPKVYLFLIGLLIILLNSYFVFGKKRYVKIEAKFSGYSKGQKLINKLVALFYIVLTVVLLYLSLRNLDNYSIK